ncbi:hypothetical protein [Kribbella pratensis]|uniref:Polyketide cyclase/dehydrase/lipid transport protein n=1 Tax=Kribbella pratensis TaxID=2512112 RepID=A0A4R8BJI8_9ACTN|nr:hypothetical protein [Kribbella pratensis]TDW54655.1 hypothetical protein EV653_7974 [Kribbella pratensis]
MTDWPTIELTDIERFRALAAGVPGAVVTERVLPAEPDRVKSMLADLDVFAEIQADLVSATVLERDGDRVVVLAKGRLGQRARLTGQLRPGWCWLQSRFLIMGMAVAAEPGGGTRVALTGGIRVPGRAAIVPIRVRQESAKSLDRLERLLRA